MIYGVVACLAFGGSLGLGIAARNDRAPGWHLQPTAASWLTQAVLISLFVGVVAAGALFVFILAIRSPQPMP